MVDISEAAKKLACELANNEGSGDYNPVNLPGTQFGMALARILQEHSDVAKVCQGYAKTPGRMSDIAIMLQSLILPEEPDALADILDTVMAGFENRGHAERYAVRIKEELSKRGLAIVPTTKRADPIIDEAGIGCGAGSVG